MRQLLAAGLVDEMRLMIHPILLGRGKRLFDDNTQASAFTLVNSISSPGGLLIVRYIRSGERRRQAAIASACVAQEKLSLS